MKLTCLRPPSLYVLKLGFEATSDHSVHTCSAVLCRTLPIYYIFNHTEELTVLYSEQPHACHLDSTVNLVQHLLYYLSVRSPLRLSVILFLMCSKLVADIDTLHPQTLQHAID